MNHNKARGDYATAYKLSGANTDKKEQRRQRRSIEQKEFREKIKNQRRNIVDLSPLHEADVTCNKSYKDKTPVKTGKKDKTSDRLEQLRKWKEEREKKKQVEGNKRMPVFRVSKALDRKSDKRLFEASKTKKHPVKPQPIPESKPVTKPIVQTTTKTTTDRSRKVQPVAPAKTRQTSNTRRETNNKNKENVTKPVTTSTRTLRSATRQPVVEKPSTKQSSNRGATNLKSKTVPKPVIEEAPSFVKAPTSDVSYITKRGDTSELPDSFAPADFTFDVSSFVFKPLSPASAAGFLTTSQDTSCSSFVESNPKRSSTPKRVKESKKNEPVINIQTTMIEETVLENDNTIQDDTNNSKKDETVVEPNQSLRRSSRRRSAVPSTEEEISSLDDKTKNGQPEPVGKATPRRSLRVSLLSANSNNTTDIVDKSSSKEKTPNVRRSTRQKSVASSSSDSEAKSGSDIDVNTDSPAKRTRRSIASTSVNEDKEIVNTPTRELRRSRRSVIPPVEPESIPEVEESSGDNDEVFENIKKDDNVPVADSDENKENNGGSEPLKNVSFKFDDAVDGHNTPSERKKAKKSRNKSFGGFRLPDADSVVLSGGRKARRKTLLSKSPEEWVEVLRNSPMVEMSRRRHKLSNASLPTLDFDDIDMDDLNSEKENTKPASSATEDSQENIPVLNLSAKIDEIANEESMSSVPENNEQNGEQSSDIVPEVEMTTDLDENKENTDTNKNEKEHDVPYFRELLRTETKRLTDICDHWTEVNETSQLTDDVHGQIRAAVGKAQLLIAQRFKQFSGLVDNCEFKTGEKETTCTDLDGFWEMVFFQVEDCDNKFAELKKLQENNWIDNTVKPVVKKVKKKVKPAVTKPVVKSKFAAFRAQMKKQKTDSVSTPDKKVEEKVFEIPGFFTVSSPVRSPKPHCAAGTPKKEKSPPSSNKDDSVKKTVLKDTLGVPSSTEMVAKTPTRKSYLPAVPSPLLQDITPLPRPTRECTKKTPIPKRLVDEIEESEALMPNSKRAKGNPVRRSLRSRQSLDMTETASDSPKPEVSKDDFSSRLLQSVSTDAANDDDDDHCDVSNESFSKYLEPSSVLDTSNDKVETPVRGMRRQSCLKGCKSTERRRSRKRSVQFVSPKSVTKPRCALPNTPYNRSSLGENKRVTRSKPAYDIFDFNNDGDNDENVPPPSYTSSRVSLLGTPPDLKRKVVPTVEVPTATLISFTP
ncbi:hypothetical protein ACF0H5_003924 [Mactra antiquata]